MDRYYCVFKLSDYIPQHTSFESQNPGTAIQKMMELANVTSTSELEEAEILKCIRTEDGKPAYIPVFTKCKNQSKGKVRLLPAPDVAVVQEQHNTYKLPYTIETL